MAKAKKEFTEPFWGSLVAVYFDFYKNAFNTDPEFGGLAAKALKGIIESLRKRAETSKVEWTEDVASKRLLSFLTYANGDDLFNNWFVLETINRHKDRVFQKIANPNKNVKRTSVIRPAIEPGHIDLNESWR